MSLTIDYHIPPPKTNKEMVDKLKKMGINGSILDTHKYNPTNWRYNANRLGIKVKCEMQECGLYRIWRVA